MRRADEASDQNLVLGTVTLSLASALSSAGLDANRLFSHVGIDLNNMLNTRERVPRKSLARLVQLCARLTGDPAFGLHISRFVHPMRYGTLSVALYTSRNLRQYLGLLKKYANLVSNNMRYELIEKGDIATVALMNHYFKSTPSSPMLADWRAAAALTDLRQVYRPDFCPIKIELARPTPTTTLEKYQQTFGVMPIFNRPHTAFYFERKILDEPLPGWNPDLLSHVERMLPTLQTDVDQPDTISMVKSLIMRILPSEEITIESIASHMNISVRTLYNRLKEENISFQQILDDTRADLAKDYLQNSDLSVKEVAYLVGYGDFSNFSRAFKRWSDITPSQYRSQFGR